MRQDKEPATRPMGAAGRLGRAALSVVLAVSLCPTAAFADSGGLSVANVPLTSADSNAIHEMADDAYDYKALNFAGVDPIACSSSILQLYPVDAEKHIAIVGNNTSTLGNGVVADSFKTQTEVSIPATIQDDSGQTWTIAAIGQNAFTSKKNTGIPRNSNTFKIGAKLDYVGVKAFKPKSTATQIYLTFENGGSIDRIEADAFDGVRNEEVDYPDGSYVLGNIVDYKANPFSTEVSVTLGKQNSVKKVVYPFSHTGTVYQAINDASLCVKSPYASSGAAGVSISDYSGQKTVLYCWDSSEAAASFKENNDAAVYSMRPMGVLSEAGWAVDEQYVPQGKEAYRCGPNVAFPIEVGASYPLNPEMQLVVSDGDTRWEPVLGEDYAVTYADSEGTALKAAPTEPGTYKVKFTGIEKPFQTIWGESEWLSYTIDPNLQDAQVSWDESATTFTYDAKAHAPEITVSIDGVTLAEGDKYEISYLALGPNGTTSSAKPTASGSYRAFVTGKAPSYGLFAAVPFMIEPVKIDSATVSDIEAGGTPEVVAYDADGGVVDPDAYSVEYRQGSETVQLATAAAGKYTAVVSGDGNGCSGDVEVPFTIVATGNTLASATLTNELVYTGEKLTPAFTVFDKNGNAVDASNYDVALATRPAKGEGEPVADIVSGGDYTATFTAKGDDYLGETSCEFSVAGAAIDQSKASVSLNRTEYDYIPSAHWNDEAAVYTKGQRIILRGEAIEPDVTVTYDGKQLAKGVDYELACSNNTGTDEKYNSKDDVTTATFSVRLIGDYSGELTSDDYKYTIRKRAHSYTYKGIRFAYALDNDGNAVITGLDMDMTYETTDFSPAYDSTAWDGETFTVPGTVKEGEATYPVTRIADEAFGTYSAPVFTSNPSSYSRDVLNGSKKLVIEQGVKEIGQRAFTCSKLTEISLPEGLEVLHAGCLFGGMMNTTKISIPSSVTTMAHCVFGQNVDYSNVAEIEFVQPSRMTLSSETMVSTSTVGDTVIHAEKGQTGVPFVGGKVGTSDTRHAAPIEEITLPANFTAQRTWFSGFGNLKNAYCMAGTYTGTRTPSVSGTGTGTPKATLWNWDTEDNPFPGAIEGGDTNVKNAWGTFKPFAVLGEGYTYKNALNVETGVCDAEATYRGNVQVGTPLAENRGDAVSVDWDLQLDFVNSKYAWAPVEGEDFTVAYADADGNAVESITQPGTYTATLTGNEKTCYGTTTATIAVGGAEIDPSSIELSSYSLMYNGDALEPAVSVRDTSGNLLEEGADYEVSYENNHAVGTGTAVVTGKNLYAGSTASAEFAITPATLTVAADNASKVQGASDPTLKCTVSGLLGADKALSYTVERKPGENPGTYAITPTGVFVFDSDGNYATRNYDVKYVDGTFTIGEASEEPSSDKPGTEGTSGSAGNAGNAGSAGTTGNAGSTGTPGGASPVAKTTIAIPAPVRGLAYTGKPQTGVAAGTGYSITGNSATKAGSYTATLTADDSHVFANGKASVAVAWSIAKAGNSVKAAKAKVTSTKKAKALKKKAATIALPKVQTAFGKAVWKVSKKDKKRVLTLKKGKVKVKKGAKKGTYTMKLKATVPGTTDYAAASSKVVTVKVKVR